MRESSQVGEMRDFNPRSHKGSDFFAVEVIEQSKNFNPRSHKGRRRSES